MLYRRLGSSELEVSEISLGSWLTYSGGVSREQAGVPDRHREAADPFHDSLLAFLVSLPR